MIYALASGSGGAIAVLRISGAGACSALVAGFRNSRGKRLKRFRPRYMHYGTLVDVHGEILDDVCICAFDLGRSYTGEEMVEVYVHGSQAVLRNVSFHFESLGMRPALPGEFTRRAFLNGRMGLSQAEAVHELIRADSEIEAGLAIKRLKGALKTRVQGLREDLIDTAAHLEATLDYPEEDIDLMDISALSGRVLRLQQQIEELLQTYRRQHRVRQGIQTVITGRPNAGKSSLMNALLKEDRAIVTDLEGTTRDRLDEEILIGGLKFVITDTAGIREARDKAEAIGIERSRMAEAEADVLIHLVDSTVPKEDKEGREPDFILLNKSDLPPHSDYSADKNTRIHRVSALTHQGLQEFLEALVVHGKHLMGDVQNESSAVSSKRQAHCLQEALYSLQQFCASLNSGIPMDIALVDLYEARDHLSQITGEIVSEDVIDRIFEKFCIGK